jgi:hypothetical protein
MAKNDIFQLKLYQPLALSPSPLEHSRQAKQLMFL